MELSATTKLPKRQETLGPTSPIHDWEVERATILADHKESKEKAERLEKELEKERRTYEKNTASLLKEVKLKEAFMEKKLKDVEEQLIAQMLELQHSLDNEKLARHEEITSLKAQHEQVLEAQDKKHLRRLTSLQERLNAKDKAYAQLLEKLPEHIPETIESLEVAKTKQDTDTDSMRKSNLNSCHSGTHQQMLEPSQLKAYKVRIEQLETSCTEAQKQSQTLKKRLDQITATHDAHVKELTEKFMSEAQHSELTNRAQLQNLQSEHVEVLRELTAQHETEKEVWQISQHAVIDDLRRQLEAEKQEALRLLNKEWKNKSQDLQASMSKDAKEIQAHWESKLEENKAQFMQQIKRLQGEMEVVKDRLGKEILRRKQNQFELAVALEKTNVLERGCSKLEHQLKQTLKEKAALEKERIEKNTQYRKAHSLAIDLLVTLSPHMHMETHANLADVLQLINRQIAIMSSCYPTRQTSLFELDYLPACEF